MLPTIAGLVVIKTAATNTSGPTRRLMPVNSMDPDWPFIGRIPVPGCPQFFGRSTEFINLGDARHAVHHARGTTITVPVP